MRKILFLMIWGMFILLQVNAQVTVHEAESATLGGDAQIQSETNAGSPILTGAIIGTDDATIGMDKSKVFDGDINSFFDCTTADDAWVGLDLGSARIIKSIKYYPRSTHPERMINGVFEGSNSPTFASDNVILYKITSKPTLAWSTATVKSTNSFRYVRYKAPVGGYGNVAEIEFREKTYDITVKSGARQTFDGFGMSEMAFPSDQAKFKVTPLKTQDSIASLLYGALHADVLRLWIGSSSPEDVRNSVLLYKKLGVIPRFLANGGRRILLAPGINWDTDRVAWANALAKGIRTLRQVDKIPVMATGFGNEPMVYNQRYDWPKGGVGALTLEQLADGVDQVNKALDREGMQDVIFCAPEAANSDDFSEKMFNAIKAHPTAWTELEAISTHSYSWSPTETMAQIALQGNKQYWMTESSNNAKDGEFETELVRENLSRYLNDLNHGVNVWVWFIGWSGGDVNQDADGGTKLLHAKPDGTIQPHNTVWYFKQANTFIRRGLVLRHSVSAQEGEMDHFGSRANINVAAGKYADGTWTIGVMNSSDQQQTVTLDIEEMRNEASVSLHQHRTQPTIRDEVKDDVLFQNGKATIVVPPITLVMLSNAIFNSPTSSGDFESPKIKVEPNPAMIIYPNPLISGNILNIASEGIEGSKNLTIYDISGLVVFNKKLTNDDNNKIDLGNANLKGLYFIKLVHENGETNTKLLIL